jgi:hypothetical protein
MDVRWIVLVKEHADDDSEEPTYLWHRLSPSGIQNTRGVALFNSFFSANSVSRKDNPRNEGKSIVPVSNCESQKWLAAILILAPFSWLGRARACSPPSFH